jgi:hypothetical protein
MSSTPITTASLTSGAIDGQGVFDILMQANKAHIEAEFNKGRITGPDYSTVYLGMVQASMQAAISFLVQRDKISLENDLLQEQINNAVLEGKVLVAQECKLRAEYDLTLATITKTGKESDLLSQKILTEKAQIMELGVDDNSVIGKQKVLYQAQTDGFKRDAEQKGTKILIDTWNARRMTDDGTVADTVNKLDDATLGRAVTKLLAGMGA